MATTTYLSQPAVMTINTTDLTDQCKEISFIVGNNSLVSTAFGDTGEKHVAGLQTVSGKLTMYGEYGVSSVEATLYAQVGLGTTTIVVRKAIGALSVSNPEYTISNTMIASFDVDHKVGELQIFDVSFEGGTWARAIV